MKEFLIMAAIISAMLIGYSGYKKGFDRGAQSVVCPETPFSKETEILLTTVVDGKIGPSRAASLLEKEDCFIASEEIEKNVLSFKIKCTEIISDQ